MYIISVAAELAGVHPQTLSHLRAQRPAHAGPDRRQLTVATRSATSRRLLGMIQRAHPSPGINPGQHSLNRGRWRTSSTGCAGEWSSLDRELEAYGSHARRAELDRLHGAPPASGHRDRTRASAPYRRHSRSPRSAWRSEMFRARATTDGRAVPYRKAEDRGKLNGRETPTSPSATARRPPSHAVGTTSRSKPAHILRGAPRPDPEAVVYPPVLQRGSDVAFAEAPRPGRGGSWRTSCAKIWGLGAGNPQLFRGGVPAHPRARLRRGTGTLTDEYLSTEHLFLALLMAREASVDLLRGAGITHDAVLRPLPRRAWEPSRHY